MPRPEQMPPTEEAKKLEALINEFNEFSKFKAKNTDEQIGLITEFFGTKMIRFEHRIKQLENEIYKE